MIVVKGVMFTMPERISPFVDEVWIRFKDGSYVFIDLEHPFPTSYQPYKLSTEGNGLLCTDAKKKDIVEMNNRRIMFENLEFSKRHPYNNIETIDKVMALLSNIPLILY